MAMQDPRSMGLFDLIRAKYSQPLTREYEQKMAAAQMAPAVESYMAGQQPNATPDQLQRFEDKMMKQNLSEEMYASYKGESDAELDDKSKAYMEQFYAAAAQDQPQQVAPGGSLPEAKFLDKAGLMSEFIEASPRLDPSTRQMVAGLISPKAHGQTGLMQNVAAAGYQSGTPEYQKAIRDRLPAIIQSGEGQFKDYDQRLKARQALRKEWTPQLAPSRESIRKFNQATDIVGKRKSFAKMTGADDTVLIKAFASMILPGEAVMEGDIATIVNQSGLPGTFQSYIQAFKGEGQLGEDQRMEIYDAMTKLAERANMENIDIRNQMQPDIVAGGFNPRGLFRSPLEYKPYKPKVPPAPKGFK